MGARDSQKYQERPERQGDRAPIQPEVLGHAAGTEPTNPEIDAEGAEVEGHVRVIQAADEQAPGEPGEEGAEVEGHFIGTHPYLMEKNSQGRQRDMLNEAERERRAGEAGGRGLGERLRDRLRGGDNG